MEKKTEIRIQLQGDQQGQPISPHNIDLHDITQYLQDIQELIGREKKYQAEHPIHVSIQNGSIIVVVTAASLILGGLINDIKRAQDTQSFHGMSPSRRQIFEKWLQQRKKRGFEYRIWDQEKTIDTALRDWTTFAKQTPEAMRLERHLTGHVIQVGSEREPLYRMQLLDGRIIGVHCQPETLARDRNRIYRKCEAIVSCDYDMLKKTEFNFRLVEWVDTYSGKYDASALDRSIMIAAEDLKDIQDPVSWTHELRGDDEA